MRIGDEPLTPAAVAAAARGGRIDVVLTPAARERVAAGRRAAVAAAERGPVYGLTTGVGANRHVAVEEGAGDAHSLRLLRSHAGGMGEPLADEVVRATILIRLAQIAAGGGGHRLEVADALAALLADGPLPVLRDLGGLGTGDLTVLGQLGLALAGEGEGTPQPRLAVEAGDALALMSSNAATLALATLAWRDLRTMLDAGLGVAALTFRALEGNPEAFAAPLAAARPLPGLAEVSERLRALAAGGAEPARIQDPFALRCVPQVGGALHQALGALHDLLAVEIGAASENPLVAGDEILHHGGFHAAGVALALDTVRLALVPFAELSLARLSHLMAPELTGLPAFLSGDAPGSSGVLIAEYLAADALARLRADAAPAVLGGVRISRGVEEHASFAWQGAHQARRATGHVRAVLALEWVAAERALRMKGVEPGGALAPLRALAAGFDERLEDRAIAADAERAAAALPALADAVIACEAAH
jgi:histidine ammonia-lyase